MPQPSSVPSSPGFQSAGILSLGSLSALLPFESKLEEAAGNYERNPRDHMAPGVGIGLNEPIRARADVTSTRIDRTNIPYDPRLQHNSGLSRKDSKAT